MLSTCTVGLSQKFIDNTSLCKITLVTCFYLQVHAVEQSSEDANINIVNDSKMIISENIHCTFVKKNPWVVVHFTLGSNRGISQH